MKKGVFVLCLSLFGCKQKAVVMERSKFVDVTAELYLAEAIAARQDTALVGKKEFFKSFQEDIFNKHQIDAATYYKAYDAYNEHIDTMQIVMNEVVNKLTMLQATGLK